MRNRLPFNGAPTLLKALLGLGASALVLPFALSCSNPAKDKVGSIPPEISAFYVTNNSHDPFTSPQTHLTITKGDSVYLMARYATTGGAVVTPGNLHPSSNVILPVGAVSLDTTYTLNVTSQSGAQTSKTAQVTAVDAPDATITAPDSTIRGTTGLLASVPDVPGSTYLWTPSNCTITAGAGTHAITFTAGSAGTGGAASSLTLICTVTNAAGRASAPSSKVVTVKAQPPAALTYANNPATYYMNVPIPVNAPALGGGDPVQLFSVMPALPAGLLLDPLTGVITGTPSATATQADYQVTATNSGGSTGKTLTIAVQGQPAVSFTANPSTIGPAGGSILSWSVDATVASITVDQGVQTAPLSTASIKAGSFNVNPAATMTYTMTANLVAGGSVTSQAKVTVDSTALAISTFTVDTALVPFGNSTNLHWTIAGTPNALTLDGASVLAQTAAAIMPVRRHTYTLRASNNSPVVTVSATKTVAARGLDLLAGSITGAGTADNANPNLAQLNGPRQIAADTAGNLYIADGLNHTIRMVAAGGGVTTLAGMPGVPGFVDSATGSPLFNNPRGIAAKADGSVLYVYDATNKAIRQLTKGGSSWTVSTIPGTSPLGAAGYGQVALDPTGAFLVVVDYSSHCVRVLRLSDNTWGVYAGVSGTYGTTDNTTPALARFDDPEGIAFNKAGTYIYVSEAYSTTISRIRMIPWTTPPATGAITSPTSGTVVTIAGTAIVAPATGIAKGFLDGAGGTALFSNPASLSVDGNDVLWVADSTNQVIRKIVVNSAAAGDSTVSTAAGTVPTGTATAPVAYSGSTDGAALAAKFNTPNGILCVGSNIYLSDTTNCVIRRFDGTVVATPVGISRQSGTTDATGALARFNAPQGVAVYQGFAYVADTTNNSLRKVALADGVTTTLATGFTAIKGVAVDGNGLVYVTDNGTAPAKSVLQIAADGTKTTILSGLSAPQNLAVSPLNPNLLYVVDNNAIQEITLVRNPDGSFASASITKTLGVAATSGYVDSPTPATVRFKIGNFFAGLAVDPGGNVFVADEGNSCIRKIAATTYAVTTIAGIGTVQTAPATNFGFIDGALGLNKFNFPMGLAFDGSGNLYVADQGNSAIRKIAPDGTVSTIIGVSFVSGTLAPNGAAVLYGAAPGALGGGASLYKPFGLALTVDGDLLVVTNDGLMQITAP